jgi:mono/diheme cytochrome c family protein
MTFGRSGRFGRFGGGGGFGLFLTSAAVFLIVFAARASASQTGRATQPARGASAPARTTMSGIYTAAQATKGEDTYFNICVACHPKATYTGVSFKKNWGGRPLLDLYVWIQDKMPKNEPGTLTPAESVQVMAYILKLNGMPAGQAELTANIAALRRIRIELKK